jgi:hypothetical protein
MSAASFRERHSRLSKGVSIFQSSPKNASRGGVTISRARLVAGAKPFESPASVIMQRGAGLAIPGSMPSALRRSITLRRTYPLPVMRFLAAAVSIAAGREAGQRIRILSVKREASSGDLRWLGPWSAPIVCVEPADPIRERGKTSSDGAAQSTRATKSASRPNVASKLAKSRKAVETAMAGGD